MLLVMSVARPLGQTTQGSRTHNNSQTWICGLAKLAQSGFRFTWDWSGPSLEEHTNLLDRLSLEAKRSLPVLKLMDALGVLRLLQGAVSTNLFGLGCPFYCFLALCVVPLASCGPPFALNSCAPGLGHTCNSAPLRALTASNLPRSAFRWEVAL